MAWKIYRSGNYIYSENTITGELFGDDASLVIFKRFSTTDTSYWLTINGVNQMDHAIDIIDMVDEFMNPFSIVTFEAFKELNSGQSSPVPGASVLTFNGRLGVVVPQVGDYTLNEVRTHDTLLPANEYKLTITNGELFIEQTA